MLTLNNSAPTVTRHQYHSVVDRHDTRHQVILGRFLRKRAFDMVFASLVILLLLSWLVPLIALIIKLESKGPVLFKQLRTGKDGSPFYCFKFRSMYTNTDADSKQASKGDSRITRVGAFLRKTSIDELPQFINVLRGNVRCRASAPYAAAYGRLLQDHP
ncbi:MAG: sugar transferase [Hymenobacter sp.]